MKNFLVACFVLIFAGCTDSNQQSGANSTGTAAKQESTPPGRDKTAKTTALEAGAAVLQDKKPLDRIHAHVCGFHFYAGDLKRQVEADHYCSHLNQDVMQCVIYDSDAPDARLIGIEYIISAQLFRGLPEDEKKLWHSHVHEVSSGMLIAPGLPEVAEKELMEDLIGTYGKTFHTWQVDRGDQLPLGIPQLMMGFTQDGQVDPQMVQRRDKQYDISSDKKRQNRADIKKPEIDSGADAWQRSAAVQLSLTEVSASEDRPSR